MKYDKAIELINQNKALHDSIASTYEDRHAEIFNPTEQARIHASLKFALSEIRTGAPVPNVMDFGAGTGNLTRHLLDLHAAVVSGDVSQGCLDKLRSGVGSSERLGCVLLNGHDLSNIENDAFDMIATYSVLHHIPDYLKIIDEFMRVVKPGGVIYIDHEVCPAYWNEDPSFQAYLEQLGERFSKEHLWELGIMPEKSWDKIKRVLYSWKKRILEGGSYSGDGDIHVYRHDHIEWNAIEAKLVPACRILTNSDYLVCREREYPAPVWGKYRDTLTDMRVLVARKQ